MAELEGKPTPPNKIGKTRKIVGNSLLGIGIAGSCISCAMILTGCSAMITDDPEHMGPAILGFLGILISLPIIAIGLGLRIARASTAALVCGILGLLFAPAGIYLWIGLGPFYATLSLLAIILGAVSLARARRNPAFGSRKAAIAGLVLGIIGIALSFLFPFWLWEFFL